MLVDLNCCFWTPASNNLETGYRREIQRLTCTYRASNPDSLWNRTTRSMIKAAELVSIVSGKNEQYSWFVLGSEQCLREADKPWRILGTLRWDTRRRWLAILYVGSQERGPSVVKAGCTNLLAFRTSS